MRPIQSHGHSKTLTSVVVLLAAWTSLSVAQKTSPGSSALSPSPGRAAFERIKTLAGTWRERSTRGWTGGETYRVIAAGSAVLATSWFDEDPKNGHGMATVFHLDGDRLFLTHYCEAGNQPRLVATTFAEDGQTVTFTFHDATNLTSRAAGHMDKVVLRFLDRNHFSSRWTWVQDGTEKWLEEVTQERVK